MLVALGECYEKLNQLVEAKKVRGPKFPVTGNCGTGICGADRVKELQVFHPVLYEKLLFFF